MTFFNKVKWVLGILLVFVLIVVTNLIDRNNFVKVRDSVITIYEDRLVANDLLMELLSAVHQKELALVSRDASFYQSEITRVNASIDGSISRYEETKLTGEEAELFRELKVTLDKIKVSEGIIAQAGFTDLGPTKAELLKLKGLLNELSKIQLTEGGKQMSISKRAVDMVELFTHIEIYLLIFLAIAIQLIVMYQPKEKS